MVDILLYVLFFALLALAVLAGYWVISGAIGGQSPMVSLFGPRPDKRLSIVEHASVDGRRRLVLVRRDDVEHLIMTGGPVDVVIETGIGASQPVVRTMPRSEPDDANETKIGPVFGRQNRATRVPQPIAE